MSREELWRDIEYLAGQLPNRAGISENERAAATYIHERFSESTPLTQLDDFYSIDAYPYLFSLYLLDFCVGVSFFAIWWPWVAFGYGLVSFLLYMAEFTGYSATSRLMPHFETQNVSARYPCQNPKRLIIVTAHYDSPKALPWSRAKHARWVRPGHGVLVACMVLVVILCAAEALNVFDGMAVRPDLVARWSAVTVLLGAAAALYTCARQSEFTRGANHNASGTAVLIALAQGLRATPLESTEVWLVATGSKEMWLSGMRHLFVGLDVDKSSTYFLNVDGVGAGRLRYVTGEGMLHVYPSNPELVRAAEASANAFGAQPMVHYGLPTDALIPLTRGYKAMTVTATPEGDFPDDWDGDSDSISDVDLNVIGRAADYVEDIVRRLDSEANPAGPS